MNYDLLFVFILWMLTITSVTVLSVHIIKKYPVYGFTTLTALYVAYLLSSQVIATRLSVYDFG
ncbi:MAG: VUT family protein, partial [Methanimicrococcus sp.]|nr:VUT family protein [Methanimicrococcus sp.]